MLAIIMVAWLHELALTALLRCNWYEILHIFNVCNWWIRTYACTCETITLIKVINVCITFKNFVVDPVFCGKNNAKINIRNQRVDSIKIFSHTWKPLCYNHWQILSQSSEIKHEEYPHMYRENEHFNKYTWGVNIPIYTCLRNTLEQEMLFKDWMIKPNPIFFSQMWKNM